MREPYLVAVSFAESTLALMLRGERKLMDNLVDVCMGNLKMINSEYVFSALEEQN